MRVYILISVVFVLTIGTGFAVNVDIGDVEAFKQALEKMDSLYNKVKWVLLT